MSWLKLDTIIGFEGSVKEGLKIHPNGKQFIYSVGNLIIIEDLKTGLQEFLQEPKKDICSLKTEKIYCFSLSKSGKYLAIGYESDLHSLAQIVVWNLDEKSIYGKYAVHKVNVECIAFSFDEQYIYSIGGIDDRRIAIYNMHTKNLGCTAEAQTKTSGNAHVLRTANNSNILCVSAGRANLRVWCLDLDSNRLEPKEVRVKKVIRQINCLQISADDNLGYAGTQSGDIIFFSLVNASHLSTFLCTKQLPSGITQMAFRPDSKDFIVGTGAGVIWYITPNFIQLKRHMVMQGSITSITPVDSSHTEYLVGTNHGNIYKVLVAESFKCSLFKTAHHHPVNDLSFPSETSKLLVSVSFEEVRVWNVPEHKELSRMVVPSHTCHVVEVTKNGKFIVTGWSDCRIRAFMPESGRVAYVINSTYGSQVFSLATTADCARVISGSSLGHVVVWYVPTIFDHSSQNAISVSEHVMLKSHRAPVTCVNVRSVQRTNPKTNKVEEQDEILSCALDGTLIIWDVNTRVPRISVKTNFTMFYSAIFHPTCNQQVIATGTGGKVSYYELVQGSLLFQASDCDLRCQVSTMDISLDGRFIVTGDADKCIKIWNYKDGEVRHRQQTHTTALQRLKMSRDLSRLVSTGKDGSIYVWTFQPPPEVPPAVEKGAGDQPAPAPPPPAPATAPPPCPQPCVQPTRTTIQATEPCLEALQIDTSISDKVNKMHQSSPQRPCAIQETTTPLMQYSPTCFHSPAKVEDKCKKNPC